MELDKKKFPESKSGMHPRNKFRNRYDLKLLGEAFPELKPFVIINKFNDETIDFHQPEAVLMLNRALLKVNYNVANWEIPNGYLCPPIPGRADYIHYMVDLLNENLPNKNANEVKCLDIGTGANLIYPIIGCKEYGWHFVGTDIDPIAIANAEKIIENNHLSKLISVRLQENPENIFQNIIGENEYFDVVICNPPFYGSEEEAAKASIRKTSNLKKKKISDPVRNFGGNSNELWTEGGEERFISNFIEESKLFDDCCTWFSTLVSKESLLDKIGYLLKEVEVTKFKIIPMSQGNKISRVVAWSFQ